MKKGLHIDLAAYFDPVTNSDDLRSRSTLVMKHAETSYWKRNADECITQEFDGGLGYLYSYELTLAKSVRIPAEVEVGDMHIMYLMEAKEEITLYTADRHTFCSIAPERARHLYLPEGNYELEIPQGFSHVFGFYYNRLLFRDGNERSLEFISKLIDADRKKLNTPLCSTDFKIGPRTRNHIRKLCQDLRKGKLSNESFIFDQLIKLINLSSEKVHLESAYSAPPEIRKVEEVRLLLQTYIEEELGLPSLTEIAAEVGLDIKTLNHYHQQIYKSPLLHFRNQFLVYRAQVLLREGFTITQVAYKLGYTDPSSFIRFFRTQVGASPQTWLSTQ